DAQRAALIVLLRHQSPINSHEPRFTDHDSRSWLPQRRAGPSYPPARLRQLFDRRGDRHAEVGGQAEGFANDYRHTILEEIVDSRLFGLEHGALRRALAQHAGDLGEHIERALWTYALDTRRFTEQFQHAVAALLELPRAPGHEVLRAIQRLYRGGLA